MVSKTKLPMLDETVPVTEVRPEIIKIVLETPIEARFKRGEKARLYLEEPKHIDDIPDFVEVVIIGIGISTHREVKYRVAFQDGERWLTCNRFYPEKLIGKLR